MRGILVVRCFQKLHQFLYSLGTMTDSVFYLIAQFGKGQVISFGKENGIITEAFSSSALSDDGSLHDAFKEMFDGLLTCLSFEQEQVASIPRWED